MSKTRLWMIGAALLAVVIVGLGWFVGVAPAMDQARKADDERKSVAAINEIHEATLRELEELDADLPNLKAELAGLREALPTDTAIATLLGQLNAIAEQNGMQLTAFSALTPEEFAASEGAAAPVAPAEAGTDTATPAPSAPETPAAPAAPIPVGTSTFVAIPVLVTVTGSGPGLMGFIENAQFGKRLLLATNVKITNDGSGSTSTVEGYIFVMEQPEGAATSDPESTDSDSAESEPANASGR
ncbi:type 4a pilus biogenesis protein PilO [Salinibacterium sp. ZJ450]|uniref:type 4a pilus biogenesis protein PilO n=1 Tax=Salinibacterium sp. ZJ450 TaxID=2708338 RepID=UPI0014217683|nr:type 4a pilus biogenesis protein PilO [Salinibacterium sp. ZJ450]